MPGKRPEQGSAGAAVLVCGLAPSPDALLSCDSSVYSRHYRHVDVSVFQSLSEMLRAIELRYDIVHLLGPLAPGGRLIDADATLLGTDLIAKCCEAGVKLLWVAHENKPENYISGFRAAGRLLT